MNPGRKSLLWVMATLAVAMAPQIARMPLPVIAFCAAPFVWRLGSEFKGWTPVSGLVKNAMTAAALVTLYVSYGGFTGRRAAVTLLALMLSLKLIECYRIRDARILVSFSLFLCATQFLFAQGILMPVYGVAVIACAMVALSQLHRAESWAALGPAPPLRVSPWSELAFSLRLLALAMPIGVAFFVLFPRLATPLWGIPETTLDSKTGLSDSMSPGSIQNLFMDDSPAFRVTFDGAVPPPEELYWRGPVFWNLHGNTWRPSFYSQNLPAADMSAYGQGDYRYTIQLEPNERKWLFSLDHPLGSPSESRLTIDFQIIRRSPVIQLMEYALESARNHLDTPQLGSELRRIALELPDGLNPKTRAQVERWREETSGDEAFYRRVLDHFSQEPFYYSLEAPLLGAHAVDEFLFDTRTGFCEHYSSAFAVMMRMAGIPARIVTGYLGGWYSELGEYMLVRQSDAHAWVEIWLESSGWTRVDPTSAVSPLRVREGSLGAWSEPRHMLDYDWIRSVRNSIDIVQQRWNDWVIDYGADRQARLLAPLGMDRMSPATLITLLGVAIALLGVIIVPFLLRIRGPASRTPLQKSWRKFVQRLEKAGVGVPASMGPNELALSAARRLPHVADPIHRITRLYSDIRYSPRPGSVKEFHQAVKDFDPSARS
jgi:transglutaminase-like putative cysteine protease